MRLTVLPRACLLLLLILGVAACAHEGAEEPRSVATLVTSAPSAEQLRVPTQPRSEDVRAELEAAREKKAAAKEKVDGGADASAATLGDTLMQ